MLVSLVESLDSTDCCLQLFLELGGVSDLLKMDCMGLPLDRVLFDFWFDADSKALCSKSGKSIVLALFDVNLPLRLNVCTGPLGGLSTLLLLVEFIFPPDSSNRDFFSALLGASSVSEPDFSGSLNLTLLTISLFCDWLWFSMKFFLNISTLDEAFVRPVNFLTVFLHSAGPSLVDMEDAVMTEVLSSSSYSSNVWLTSLRPLLCFEL
ncbi:hypothetical protein BpHYR1_054387 [Brachionus plicatilis]|uniref:Uncharacterized protein n=1 Tax=Brachionus plicatilis TaxID=10195 RepID=A0A3M7QII7_BRAPC|nr:hypothetical protein BpHYR1_054387 [Brachionus plicatilis]